MAEIEDEEIQIGKSKIGLGTTIKLNVKTLLWIMGLLYGGLSSIAGYAYYNLKSEIETRNEMVSKENDDLKKYISTELKDNLNIVNSDIKTIIREQGDMKGDIKVLLNKTGGLRTTGSNNENDRDRGDNSLDDLNINNR